MRLPKPKYIFFMVIGAGLIGVGYAVWFGVASDGGRGGAVGVALSLGIMLAGPQSGNGTSKEQPKTKAPVVLRDPFAERPDPLEARVEQLETDLVTVRNEQAVSREWDKIEKAWLAAASALGTIFWGFGDIAARSLGASLY